MPPGLRGREHRRLFRTYEKKFDRYDLYLRVPVYNVGKVYVIMDASPVHTAGVIRDYIREEDRLRVTHVPTATLGVSAMENYWNKLKRDVLVSEYYSAFEDVRRALPEYLRTSRTQLDVRRFIGGGLILFKSLHDLQYVCRGSGSATTYELAVKAIKQTHQMKASSLKVQTWEAFIP